MPGIKIRYKHFYFFLFKGSDWQCMVVELRMQFCKDFLKIHLRPIRCVYGA